MPLQLLGLAGILTWAMSSVSLPAILNATRTLQEKQQSSTTPIHSSWAFLVAMTTVISSWSTMSLNIADISRFAKSQRAQALGQLAGFVLPNVAVATVGILTTGAASALYPAKAGSFWNFVTLFEIWPVPVAVLGSLLLALSILSHNLAANVVSPANDFVNLCPRWISFRRGEWGNLQVTPVRTTTRAQQTTARMFVALRIIYSSATMHGVYYRGLRTRYT